VRFRIELVRIVSGERIGSPRTFDHEFIDPNRSVYGRFMLTKVVFPAAGRYTVELFCDDEFLDDQVVQVIAQETSDEAGR
jgi:hypothetical protein